MTKAGAQGPAGLADKVRAGDRRALARAITLIESTKADHAGEAEALLEALLPHSGNSVRIGISGVPGVGKSTFIERFGLQLVAAGHKVAVLAVDPSSKVSGGSILGDKTRMTALVAELRERLALVREGGGPRYVERHRAQRRDHPSPALGQPDGARDPDHEPSLAAGRPRGRGPGRRRTHRRTPRPRIRS